MNQKLTFAERVLILRRSMGLTQEAFALKVNISRAYLSQIESGREPSTALQGVILKLEEKQKSWKTPTESEFSKVEEGAPTQSEHLIRGGRAKLKAARIAKGMSVKELCKVVGYTELIYRGIEDGSSNMSRKMAERVAKVLDISVEELLDGSDHPPSKGALHGTVGETPDIELPKGQKARYVPLISMARCGALEHGDMVAFDDGGYEHEGFLAFNPTDPNTFAVTLAGDSMMPMFAPGDVAVIYPNKPPKNGGIVLAKLNNEHGDGVMVKLYQHAGDQVTLSSYNPAYPAMSYRRKDFAWIYHVASVTKVFPS